MWCGLWILLVNFLFLEYEYISESETDLSDTCFTSEHMCEDIRPSGNASRRTDDVCKQHETPQTTPSLGVENEFLHQATDGEYTCAGKNQKDKNMFFIPGSPRQANEITDAIDDHPKEFHSKGMHESRCKTNGPPADEYQNDIWKSVVCKKIKKQCLMLALNLGLIGKVMNTICLKKNRGRYPNQRM